jgi:hypothetical protein
MKGRWIQAPILLTLCIIQPGLAQTRPNSVLTGFAGVRWGASLDSARTVLGTPDSVATRGDTTVLRYFHRSFAGMPGDLWLNLTRGAGVVSGGYAMANPGCGTSLTRLTDAVTAAYPQLVAPGRPAYMSNAPPSANRDSVCANATFTELQFLEDPAGPGLVMAMRGATPGRPPYLIAIFIGEYRGRRPGAPPPSDSSRAARTFGTAGVELTMMPGFPLPREVRRPPGHRLLASQYLGASIALTIFDPVREQQRWSSERRLRYLEALLDDMEKRGGGRRGRVQIRDGVAYGDAAWAVEGDSLRRAVRGRVYVALAGVFHTVMLSYTEPDPPQANVDQLLMEMLDSVRLTGAVVAAP